MVGTDVERNDIDFVSRALGCQPVAHVDSFTADKLGGAALVHDVTAGGVQRVVKVTGVANPGNTITILMRGANRLIVDAAARSMHDALCVVRALVQKRYMIAGGGDRKSVVSGKSVSVRVALGGRRNIKKKKKKKVLKNETRQTKPRMTQTQH